MNNQIEIYQGIDGQTQIEVKFEQDTVWLSQEQIAALFRKGRSTITEHIRNVFKEGELEEPVVCREFRHTTPHGAIVGKTQEKVIKHYNLDVIISVGYRVKSNQGTQFRIWATKRLKDYLIQGYAINENRLAQKEQEVKTLKDGIRILSRAIQQKEEDQNLDWLNHFAKGLKCIHLLRILDLAIDFVYPEFLPNLRLVFLRNCNSFAEFFKSYIHKLLNYYPILRND